jgi:hypothetical protein
LEITARLHDYIAAWPEGASYLGFLFARGESADEVERGLRLAHGELRFAIRERLAVEHPVTGRVKSDERQKAKDNAEALSTQRHGE